MSTLKQLQAMASSGMALVVTPRHIQWLEYTKGEVMYTPEAMAYAADVWSGKYKKDRHERYSPSSLGQCERRIVLGYRDAPKDEIPTDQLDQMYLGTIMHLAWQMEGLSAGWLKSGETFTHDGNRLGGSMDGVLYDDSIFELKTVRSQLYSRYVARENAPKFEHLLQIEAYMRCSGMDRASLLYQDRDSGMTHEFRVKADPKVEDALDEILERLDGHVDIDTLPKMLADCEMKTGSTFARCQVRTECLRLGRVALNA